MPPQGHTLPTHTRTAKPTTVKEDRTCGGTAVYLRCYPYDSAHMAPHLHALKAHADRLVLPAPAVFLDNGVSSRTVQPQLRLLLARAAQGHIETVLVPGSWVFSLNDRAADAVIDFLHGAGTQVVQLPSRRDIWWPQPQLVAAWDSSRPVSTQPSRSLKLVQLGTSDAGTRWRNRYQT
ncbi:recombinase family protein [Streptomyces sp. AP-93]|uniref:recombinase family protein n=1 Tax=Streptomyces sp. AP-93 TaxID=2929048 RepID=UPI001FAF84F3|nr:recombinase family protein [Streptomyces sp. AP-93]MCJ0869592.1 recombinase family protein [Streptomyces sp. AP-93]